MAPDLSTPEGKLVERLRAHGAESWAALMDEAADALSRIAAERDEALTECKELQAGFAMQWNADMRAIKRWQDATGKKLTWPDSANLSVWLLERFDAAERERDELKAEVAKLREIVSKCAAALPNGAFVAPTASLEMMAHLPGEISLVCARLRTPEESP